MMLHTAASKKNGSKVPKQLPSERFFLLLSETYKALSDCTRVKIVWALWQKELSVGQISQLVGISQSAISHHLRTLRNLNLVRVRRDGVSAFYSLSDEHIGQLLESGREHVDDLLK